MKLKDKHNKETPSEIVVKVRGFNFKQAKAKQILEMKFMKWMVLEKMNRKKSKEEKTYLNVFPKGIKLMIPQSNIVSKGKCFQELITSRTEKSYANLTFDKRTFAKSSIPKKNSVTLHKDRKFQSVMKYFTMPFGFKQHHIELLQSKFDKIAATVAGG